MKVWGGWGCVDEFQVATRPISVGWVDVSTGDFERPETRSRLADCKTMSETSIDTSDVSLAFAGTPPLEAVRAIFSSLMTRDDNPGVFQFHSNQKMTELSLRWTSAGRICSLDVCPMRSALGRNGGALGPTIVRLSPDNSALCLPRE